MSTKNLARTLIEGGRSSYSKGERKHSHSKERVLTRMYLARASQYDDGFDAYAIDVRPKVYKDFADKLGAPMRWLSSHVGRPWSKVRSEMFQRFDPRTLAGRHIIFCHLLRQVAMWHDPDLTLYRRSVYIVDRHGILREPERRARRSGLPGLQQPCRRAGEVHAWSAGRKVSGAGDALYWCVLTRQCPRCANGDEGCCCPLVNGKHYHQPHEHYRQDQRLSDDDLVFWQGVPEDLQAQLRRPPVNRKPR